MMSPAFVECSYVRPYVPDVDDELFDCQVEHFYYFVIIVVVDDAENAFIAYVVRAWGWPSIRLKNGFHVENLEKMSSTCALNNSMSPRNLNGISIRERFEIFNITATP